jgi:hypothetical protein
MGRLDVFRYVGFVALNAALASGAAYWVWRGLPPLRDEPAAFLFLPLSLLSLVALVGLYPVLLRLPRGAPRFLALYAAFVAVLVGYGIYLGLLGPRPPDAPLFNPSFILLAVGMGHLYGLPLLLGLAAVNRLCSPVFFPPPAGAQPTA